MAVKQFIEVKFRPATADKAAAGAAAGPASLKGASRVQIRKDSLIELTGSVENGRLCYIERVTAEGDAPTAPRREAVLWLTPDPNLGRAVAKISRPFQEAAGLNYTDTYRIVAADSAPEVARDVVLEDLTPAESAPPIQARWMAAWVANVKAELDILDLVFPGMVLKDVPFMRQKRTFVVRTVNGLEHNDCRVAPETGCTITATADAVAALRPPPRLEVAAVEGLDEQIRELNCFLRGRSSRWGASLGTSGLVLHGGSGTGKSMLLDRIAATGWGTVHRIRSTDKSTAVADVFKACRANPRNLVLVDDLDKLIDKERANRSTVINALADSLDAASADVRNNKESPLVVIVAACRDYITSVPEDLRHNGRFDRAVLLPPLDAARRRAVISSLTTECIHPDVRPDLVSSLGERTHAYNGRDLSKLLSLVGDLVLEKMTVAGLTKPPAPEADATGGAQEEEDSGHRQQPPTSELPSDPAFYSPILEAALLKVRPTAMLDVNLKPPPMRWDDISGQDTIKRELRFAVDVLTWPREEVEAYIGTPPKGFLLYGPPGCSKTMTAQAMATECGLNFFAVKGAELLNMYVGESERQIRDLFARARAAAPSMIFFDEIDSIAGSRKGFGEGGSSGASSGGGGSGLNVLTTLLNEMDGFEDLRGVLVLAATNRPQALDPAIMRPGRFDEIIYVPPPDPAARESILRRNLARRRMAPDVDMARLVALTEGNSGAEVVSACRTAGKLAFRRCVDSRRATGTEEAEKVEVAISMADLVTAVAGQRKLITADMLQAYAAWEKQFR